MSIYTKYVPEGNEGLFLKLKDGDKIAMRIASPCAVSLYKAGDKIRYNWVVWNRKLDRPQIFGTGVSVFKQIAALVEDWGEPDTFDIRVSRTGSGINDTEYIVTPVKTSEDLTEAQDTQIAEIDILANLKGSVWLEDFYAKKEFPTPSFIETGGENNEPVIEDIPDGPIDMNDIPDFESAEKGKEKK